MLGFSQGISQGVIFIAEVIAIMLFNPLYYWKNTMKTPGWFLLFLSVFYLLLGISLAIINWYYKGEEENEEVLQFSDLKSLSVEYWYLVTCNSFVRGMDFAIAFFLTTLFVDRESWSVTQANIIIGGTILILFPTSILFGSLIDWYGKHLLYLMIGNGLLFSSFFVYIFSPNCYHCLFLLIGLILQTLATNMEMPAGFAVIPIIVEKRLLNTAYAIQIFIGYFSTNLFILYFGIIRGKTKDNNDGYFYMFLTTACISIIIGILYFHLQYYDKNNKNILCAPPRTYKEEPMEIT